MLPVGAAEILVDKGEIAGFLTLQTGTPALIPEKTQLTPEILIALVGGEDKACPGFLTE